MRAPQGGPTDNQDLCARFPISALLNPRLPLKCSATRSHNAAIEFAPLQTRSHGTAGTQASESAAAPPAHPKLSRAAAQRAKREQNHVRKAASKARYQSKRAASEQVCVVPLLHLQACACAGGGGRP